MTIVLSTMLMFISCEQSDSGVHEHAHSEHVHADSEPAELAAFEVTGTIIDDDGAPVPEAMVMVGGRSHELVYTDSQGQFSLWFKDNGYGEPAIVASKQGFRSVGYEFFKPDTPITIKIRRISDVDNEEYVYEDPGDGFDHMKEDCSHCHTGFVLNFLDSKHIEATSNPLLQDLYAGITRASADSEECEQAGGRWMSGLEPGTAETAVDKCYIGGVLPDLNESCGGEGQLACDDPMLSEEEAPTAFGACADCHAPGINGVAGGRNLHDAVGIEYDYGVQCDSCHKVKDIDMSKPPGVGQRMVMGRPSEPGRNAFVWDPVYYGPLKDVPNVAMGGSPQEKFNESVFCAGCHEQQQQALLPNQQVDEDRWPLGIDVHTTYSEWEAGPYNQEKTQCQFCHMPANTELNNSVDISTFEQQSITFGFPREPEDIRKHTFRGPLQGEPRLIDEALYISIKTDVSEGMVNATVSVANVGCGHAVPTGEPMRSMLLVVEAEANCGVLAPVGGETIIDTGGYKAMGVVGSDAIVEGATLVWQGAAATALVGDTVRFVRPSGEYDNYEGVGLFAGDELSPEQKGVQIFTPVGEATIVQVTATEVLLDSSLSLTSGDVAFVGQSWSQNPTDGQTSTSVAGLSGKAFSKVLLDAQGNRHVPHYKAVDIASDNRIPPGSNALSSHSFSVPSGCSTGTIRATMLYRPIPMHLAAERGWEAKDYIIASGHAQWTTDQSTSDR